MHKFKFLHHYHPHLSIHTLSANQIFQHNLKIKSFSLSGDLSAARHLFDQMPNRDVVSFNSMLTAYWQHSQINESINLFNAMPYRNTISYNSIIAGCFENNMPEAAFKYFNQMPVKNVASWNAMISGLVKLGLVEEAERLFIEMPVKNVVSCTAMIDGLMKKGEVERARKMFDEMEERNRVSWVVMISGYVENEVMEEAEQLFRLMSEKSVEAVTAMVTGHSKDGNVERARRLFDGIRVKDLVSWNAMMSGYANNEHHEEVLKLQRKMLESGIKPDYTTLIIVLTACSSLALLERGKQTHAIAVQTRLDSSTSLSNALITMYSKCGGINDSHLVFKHVQIRDIVTWNTIIAAWAQHGHHQKVLDLFYQMKENGLFPNGVTFLSMLSACRHSGNLNEALHLFETMESKYHISPRSEHYACLIDMLSRAGRLEKAYDYIKYMPFKADVTVWGSFLSGCQMYSNTDFGEIAAEKIVELDLRNSGACIILSNIYAKNGNWDGVNRVRSLMKGRGVKKLPGYSWIEVAGKVHHFTVGDASHSDIDKVCSEIRRLCLHMEMDVPEVT